MAQGSIAKCQISRQFFSSTHKTLDFPLKILIVSWPWCTWWIPGVIPAFSKSKSSMRASRCASSFSSSPRPGCFGLGSMDCWFFTGTNLNRKPRAVFFYHGLKPRKIQADWMLKNLKSLMENITMEIRLMWNYGKKSPSNPIPMDLQLFIWLHVIIHSPEKNDEIQWHFRRWFPDSQWFCQVNQHVDPAIRIRDRWFPLKKLVLRVYPPCTLT